MKRSMVFEGVAVTLLILLAFLVLAMLLSGGGREVSSVGEIRYTYVGEGDTLYVISGDSIRAVGGDGAVRWTFKVPQRWSVCDYGFYYPNPYNSAGDPYVYVGNPIMAASDGILYVYMRPARADPSTHLMDGALVAISGGKELWEVPLAGHNASDESPYYSYHLSDTRVSASGGRVYVFHDYNETVIGEDGRILWSLGDVAAPAAVDGRGFVYVDRAPANRSLRYPYSVYVPDHREPSNLIEAYYPNGTLYWALSMDSPLALQYDGRTLTYASVTLPIYDNDTVYAPAYDGIGAIDPNGTVRWTRTYDWGDFKFDWPFDVANQTAEQKMGVIATERMYANYDPSPGLERYGITVRLRLYAPMPFDSRGNVYLQCKADIPTSTVTGFSSPGMFLITLAPDGREVSRVNIADYTFIAVKDGIGYATDGYGFLGPVGNELRTMDVMSGRELWNYTFTAENATTVILDRDNVRGLVDQYAAEEALNNSLVSPAERVPYGIGPVVSGSSLGVFPGNNTTYVSFQSVSYENPMVLGKSNYTYYSGVYAFDRGGRLLWQKPTLPFKSVQVTRNGTVFYQTKDGRIGVTGAGIAAGFTLTALLYLFLRFLLVGAVARAKARLGKNDNRNRILDYIAKNPGSSLYEVARGTGVNLGTVRYHLFILGLNHKVVASHTDGKYVRYFTNSGTYSKKEQLVLSLMRRGAIGKVLGLMLEKPGVSNAQIARELGFQESVVCRCTKELAEKGVIARDGVRGYNIEEGHRELVASAVKRIYGE